MAKWTDSSLGELLNADNANRSIKLAELAWADLLEHVTWKGGAPIGLEGEFRLDSYTYGSLNGASVPVRARLWFGQLFVTELELSDVVAQVGSNLEVDAAELKFQYNLDEDDDA